MVNYLLLNKVESEESVLLKKILMAVLVVMLGVLPMFGCNENKTNQNVVRIHIRANSNSEADQQIKLKVRDDVLAFVTPLIAGCKDSDEVKNILSSNTQSINQIADNVLIENGFDYIANSRVSCEYFPSRNYNGTIFEADYYDALIVNLGSGEGNNWWCVAYPPLCFVGEETGGNVVYKSKLLELINKYFGR